MALPTAVQRADEQADAAIAADGPSFDAAMAGLEDGQGGILVHDETAPAPTPGQRQETSAGQGARTDEAQPGQQDNAAGDQKIEMTQAEFAQKIEAARREVKGLFETRLANLTQLTEENKNLRKRVTDLETEVASLTANARPDVAKLREEYPEFAHYDDDELASIVAAMQKTVAKALNKALPSAQQTIRQEIDAGNKAAAAQTFVAQIDKKYPGFIELDRTDNPAWVAFLDSAIPGTGGRIRYRHAATDAFNSADVQGLSEIIDEFARQSGAVFGSQPDSRVVSQVRARQTGGRPAPKQSDKPVFTQAQVAKFRKDYNSGAIKRQLSPEAINALLTDIEEAEAEGRIIPQ